MNTETGQLYEGVEEIKLAKYRGEPLVDIPLRDFPRVRAMTTDDRLAFANQLLKRRKQTKAKRKANRKRRGRR